MKNNGKNDHLIVRYYQRNGNEGMTSLYSLYSLSSIVSQLGKILISLGCV
jgi:hypothetical protein